MRILRKHLSFVLRCEGTRGSSERQEFGRVEQMLEVLTDEEIYHRQDCSRSYQKCQKLRG